MFNSSQSICAKAPFLDVSSKGSREAVDYVFLSIITLKYICCWSGGKDSTTTIILCHEHNIPLDTIIFSEVMFDKANNISGENPLHMDFIINTAKPLFESWGYEVLILRSETDYLENFYKIVERPIKHMENAGKFRGFPISRQCAIKRDCKERPIRQYFKSLDEEYIQYVGICATEPTRLDSMRRTSNKVSILEKFGYSDDMNRQKCLEYGLLSPAYDFSKRQGCWMCPNTKLAELRYVRENMPDAYNKFLQLESEYNLAASKWSCYGCSLKDIEEQLKSEA